MITEYTLRFLNKPIQETAPGYHKVQIEVPIQKILEEYFSLDIPERSERDGVQENGLWYRSKNGYDQISLYKPMNRRQFRAKSSDLTEQQIDAWPKRWLYDVPVLKHFVESLHVPFTEVQINTLEPGGYFNPHVDPCGLFENKQYSQLYVNLTGNDRCIYAYETARVPWEPGFVCVQAPMYYEHAITNFSDHERLALVVIGDFSEKFVHSQ